MFRFVNMWLEDKSLPSLVDEWWKECHVEAGYVFQEG